MTKFNLKAASAAAVHYRTLASVLVRCKLATVLYSTYMHLYTSACLFLHAPQLPC